MKNEKDICWAGRKWTFQSEDQRIWLERMAVKGWTAPTWPSTYCGGGLSLDQAKILKQEMDRSRFSIATEAPLTQEIHHDVAHHSPR